MDILQGKCGDSGFLGVKADGNPLNRPDIVHRALLVKIGQGDVPAGLVDLDGGNGSGHLLDQRQLFLPVAVVGMIDQLL